MAKTHRIERAWAGPSGNAPMTVIISCKNIEMSHINTMNHRYKQFNRYVPIVASFGRFCCRVVIQDNIIEN